MFGLFSKTSKEETFWNWFKVNQTTIEEFVDSDHTDYFVYNKLTEKIKAYHPALFPELTKSKDNHYVLIITPDGMKEGFEATKKLGESYPPLEGWLIKKFRQPHDDIQLSYHGLVYPSSDIEILPSLDRTAEKINLAVFIRNMNENNDHYKGLAFLYLDHILGEFNTITKIGYIDFHPLEPDKSIKNSISILALRELIIQELY